MNIKPCVLDNIVPNNWYAVLGYKEEVKDQFAPAVFSGQPFKVKAMTLPFIVYSYEPYVNQQVFSMDLRYFDLVKLDETFVQAFYSIIIRDNKVAKIAENVEEIQRNLAGKT
jgi:hypothetical protein